VVVNIWRYYPCLIFASKAGACLGGASFSGDAKTRQKKFYKMTQSSALWISFWVQLKTSPITHRR